MKKPTGGGPTTAQQVLASVGVESDATRKAHMISDVNGLLTTCGDLLIGVARSTGSILNNPELRSAMQPEDVQILTNLAGNLQRDSETFGAQLNGLREEAAQLSKIQDWPDFLVKGMTLTESLVQWQASYSNVVLPTKDQIDNQIRAVIARAKLGEQNVQ